MIEDIYKQYLEEILNEYYTVHLNPEHNITKKELDEYITNYLSNHNVTNDYEFRYFILHILKQLNGKLDDHTCLECKNHLFLPFELKFLNDGFYVVDGSTDIKYSKLIKINGIDINTILDEMENITSYETKLWLYLKEQNQLKDIFFLRMLPFIGSDTKEFKYTFIKDNKEIEKVYTREDVKCEIPLKFNDNATYKIIDNKVVYKLVSCMKDEKFGFKEKIEKSCKELDEIITNQNIKEFILDLRGNSGGSDTILGPLYELFDNYFNKLSFKVLVDRETFSCGTIVLRYLLAKGKIITFGEGIGEPFNDFGNFNNRVFLGDIFMFHASNKYFCFNDNKLFYTKDREVYNSLSDEQKSPLDFIPDVVINESIDDVKNNKDIVLETALNYNN